MTHVRFYHVEWNGGVILGRFFPTYASAYAFAESKANDTRKPTKLTPVILPTTDPDSIVLLANADDDALQWLEEETETVEPPSHG